MIEERRLPPPARKKKRNTNRYVRFLALVSSASFCRHPALTSVARETFTFDAKETNRSLAEKLYTLCPWFRCL